MSNAFPTNNHTSYKKQSTEQSDKTDNLNKHSNLTQQSKQKETNYFSSSNSNHASFKENKNHSKYSSFVKEYKEGRDVKDKKEGSYREVKDTRQVVPKDLNNLNSNYNSTSGIVDNYNFFPQSSQNNQPNQSQSTQINEINSSVTYSSHYKNSNNPNVNDVYNNNLDSNKMRSSVKQDSFKDKNTTTTTTPKTKTKRNEKDREKENYHSSKREKENENESSSIISEADQALIIKMLYFFQTSKDKAFAFLFKNRDKIKNLARIIWYTPGLVTIFLQEIISMYSIIDKVEIKKEDILSSYNIISLFQLLVLDKEINNKVVQCKIHINLILLLYIL